MPHRDPEARREWQRKFYARNPGYQRAQYAKHREKRLAAKKAAYLEDIEKSRAYVRSDYAKHAESRAKKKAEYRSQNREKTNKQARESYHRRKQKDDFRARRKKYYLDNYEKIYKHIQQWREKNPERELLYHAKRLLNEAIGIKIADIPNDLAEAKALQIKLHRISKVLRDRETAK